MTNLYEKSSPHEVARIRLVRRTIIALKRRLNGRAETTAQAFLGLRLTCARCHKHPF